MIYYHPISNLIKSFIGIVLLLVLLSIPSCQPNRVSNEYRPLIDCSVDIAEMDEDNCFWYDRGFGFSKQKLNLSGILSDQEAHSGTHSVLLTGKKVYGLSTKFESLNGNERFRVSVWRKGKDEKSALVVQGNIIYSLYEAKKKASEYGEDGWEKLEINIDIPPNISSFKVYVWNIDSDSVYFDDIRIEELGPKEFPVFAAEPKLHLYFTDGKMKKFEEKRIVAFNDGVHFGDGTWMKGVLSDENSVMPIKARFKGDWLDHLKGQKWSFRIKMRDDYAFNRMRVFSVQSPNTRHFLHEYIAHQLFDQEDVLTTRYGFSPLYLNGKSLGLYAWEEHFAKQLLEYNLRREGPIVKFDEDPFWRNNQHIRVHNEWLTRPYFETAKVIAFGMSKTLSKPNLKSQFSIAESLMYQYKDQQAPIDEIFNIDALAKYWALNDIVNGRHGLAWHNQRMYYNPVLCKLEPINFDNFTEEFDKKEHVAILSATLLKDQRTEPEHQLLKSIFTSPLLLEKYFYYLDKYTDSAFIDHFLAGQKKDIEHYQSLIDEEFTEYHFDSDFLYKNIKRLKSEIVKFKETPNIEDLIHQKLKPRRIQADTSYLPNSFKWFVNSYYSVNEYDKASLLIENFTGRTIDIIGLADVNNKMLYVFNEDIILNPYDYSLDDTTLSLKQIPQATQLAFRVNDHEEVFYADLSLWKKNTSLSPYQQLLRSFKLENCDLFEQRGDSLIVSGVHELRSKVLVPKDKIVVFEAGTELNILHEAAFISHAPVYMNGTDRHPIKIFSSDSSANAFTVLQAKERSVLNHVVFEDLNTLDYDGWTLTGSVNFYESDVDINHCSFINNHCEDALNIVRSDFHVTQSAFKGIFADAFDSDFCTGILDYSSFDEVGNDAIDFSTSQINIEHCEITNIQDKGISGGEGSTLWVRNTNIINCNIGAASKDLSMVELQEVSIENCYYGLVALKKKPEYGPAIFETKNLKLKNCQVKHLIEINSVVNYNGRRIEGTQQKVAELFY